VAGLAGLFSVCVDCFDLIQTGRSLSNDYTILTTRLGNLLLQFKIWGQGCGLLDPRSHGCRLDEKPLRSQLTRTMECMVMLFIDSDELVKKYNAKSEIVVHQRSNDGRVVLTTNGARVQVFRESGYDFLYRISHTQKKSSILATARWVLDDRKKLVEIINHLDGFLGDLESLTARFDITEQQQRFEGTPSTPYAGRIFNVLFIFHKDYPVFAPRCRYLTKVYHPNIDSNGKICLDILVQNYTSAFKTQYLAICLWHILSEPGLEDPLVPEIAEIYVRDRKQCEENARKYTLKYATVENALAIQVNSPIVLPNEQD
jgi:ubiquitin-conjugating enzyme E2 D